MTENRQVQGRAAVSRPLVFGEVLFDEFADGLTRLGGAPLNVAWHLRGFDRASSVQRCERPA